MSRFIRPHELLYIWINKTPDTFMPELNQWRLVHLKSQNPKATITLLTASNNPETGAPFLTPTAQAALKTFCQIHQLELLELSAVKTRLTTKTEHKLFKKILQEITAARASLGGNLGAARDLCSALAEILKRGIYADCDTHINTAELPDILEVQTEEPILLTGHRYTHVDPDNQSTPATESNIDILVPTFLTATSTQPDEKFLANCQRIQQTILRRYTALQSVFEAHNLFKSAMQIPTIRAQLTLLLDDDDLFGLRRWFTEKMTYDTWLEMKKKETATDVMTQVMPYLKIKSDTLKMTVPQILSRFSASPKLCHLFCQQIECTPNFIKFFQNTHQPDDLVIYIFFQLERMKDAASKSSDAIGELNLSQAERAVKMSPQAYLQELYRAERKMLLKTSVQSITGPDVWTALFREDLTAVTLQSLKRFKSVAISAQMVTTRLGQKAPLSHFLRSTQSSVSSYDQEVVYQLKEAIEDFLGQNTHSDLSWIQDDALLAGAFRLEKATVTIQHAYRQHRMLTKPSVSNTQHQDSSMMSHNICQRKNPGPNYI